MKNLKKILASLLAVSMVASFASFSVSAAVGDQELGRGEVIFEEDFNSITSIDELADYGMEYVESRSAGAGAILTDASQNLWKQPMDGNVVELKGDSAGTGYTMVRIPLSALDDEGDGIYLFEIDMCSGGTGGIGLKFDESYNNGSAVPDLLYRITGATKGDIYLCGNSVAKSGMNNANGTWGRVSFIYNADTGMFYAGNNGLVTMKRSALNYDGIPSAWSEKIPNVKYFMFGTYGKQQRATYDNLKITKLNDEEFSALGFVASAGATGATGVNLSAQKTTLAEIKAGGYVALTGCNATGEDATVKLVAAAYDTNGNLVAVQSGDATITAANGAGSPTIKLNAELLAANVTEIKFFAWDGLATMVPMTQSVSFN